MDERRGWKHFWIKTKTKSKSKGKGKGKVKSSGRGRPLYTGKWYHFLLTT